MPQIYGVLSFPTGAKNSINPEDGATGALWDLITIYDATFLPMEDGLCITERITPPSSPAHHLFPSSRFSHPTTKVPSLLEVEAAQPTLWATHAQGLPVNSHLKEFPRLGPAHSEHLK